MTSGNAKTARRLAIGLGFLAPNIIGFLAFTLLPLIISFSMAFTNWDIQLHNIFREEPLRFVFLENFVRLYREPYFTKYLLNTLFMMMGIPFGVAGSLCAALLLSQEMRGRRQRTWLFSLVALVMIFGLGALVVVGYYRTAMSILLCGVAGVVIFSGALGGRTVYRTLFYLPHFTAGVATYILWKKLYSPHTGPVNHFLAPVLSVVADAVNALPAWGLHALAWGTVAATGACLGLAVLHLVRAWRDGESGVCAVLLGAAFVLIPAALSPAWCASRACGWVQCVLGVGAFAAVMAALLRPREFHCGPGAGIGRSVIVCGALMVVEFVLLGVGSVLYLLPELSADGLEPPEWIASYHWAKPSLMIMGFWAAVGSNNMLLYLAGLSNVPTELYEAADIDGASGLQRFWHVTWPQLAPVTFFILVMSIIGGLQGGFEAARTMTRGGPAGATTPLSYFVYMEGFETGRLGYASAIAWALFALIFAVTLFNWKFGNRYVND